MNIRFQADNDLKFAVVRGVRLREPSINFASAAEAKFDYLSDPEILEQAARDERVLVSHDRQTMIDHFRNRLAAGKSSPGLALVSQGVPIGLVVESILILWAVSSPVELSGQIFHLPRLTRHVFPR